MKEDGSGRLGETPSASTLSDHVEESVDAVAKFHEAHYSSAPPLQKAIDHITDELGRPRFVVLLLGIVVAWTCAALASGRGIEAPTFAGLELAATLTALLVAVPILVTQRREDQLAVRRAQLILELSVLSDRKSAKIIALLEELRRDTPAVGDRVDTESEDMQQTADPMTVLAAIDKRHDQAG